jgi:antitoxin (DNA-binding transcriptional repressor) of toxin-antitoxin stability system
VLAVGQDGQPVTLTVRGVQVALIMPVSVAQGGDLELAEIPGLGPVLPSTARELLAHADTVQRITVDSTSGQVLTVDTPVPGPGRRRDREPAQQPGDEATTAGPDLEPGTATDAADPGESAPILTEPEPEPASVAPEAVQGLLEQLTTAPVEVRDLSSEAYRPPDRLRRHVERRDRTCTFPGCTVPGERCDLDHREPWPHGPTTDTNCHCLCRRHHRAKQAYFTVELDPDTGDTLWTTPDGHQYRRPPPTY